jgi:hypothetical protein
MKLNADSTRLLMIFSLISVAIGLYFRLNGFSKWPLAVDEYYIYRSVQFILDNGLPAFPCGGFYTRGILYQYLAAFFIGLGITPEAALRGITIASSLIMLPAAYIIAKELGGYRSAAVVLVILSLSAWQIEMARFARMYAPFQALFLWYVYHGYFLVTRNQLTRWRWLLLLSLAAPFVWEGGIFLSLFNFIPILMGIAYYRWRHLAASIAIFCITFVYLSTNFRFLGTPGPSNAGKSDVNMIYTKISPLVDHVPIIGMQVSNSFILNFIIVIILLILLSGTFYVLLDKNSNIQLRFAAVLTSALILINQLFLLFLQVSFFC